MCVLLFHTRMSSLEHLGLAIQVKPIGNQSLYVILLKVSSSVFFFTAILYETLFIPTHV